MASGFGPSGGRSRCFPQWQETHKCFVIIARLETIKKEELKQIAERKKREENAKKSGVATEEVVQLNLISNDKQ
ncbi:hypothetical protein DSO57_1015564 [Entomophthora muscae]|uniref:Uncharacterized protein n=1 Tax=Entomophthora muscae TaxID=34485 RepID=A0ACC2RWE4_9FUNG|nr:hypothetical protein DSO57_1015564 [Entomophthora muscae]